MLANCVDGLLAGKPRINPSDVALADLVAAGTRLLKPPASAAGGGEAGSPAKAKKGGSKTYHPILGWVSGSVADVANAPGEEPYHVKQQAQLRALWRAAILRRLFCLPALTTAPMASHPGQPSFEPEPEHPQQSTGRSGLFGRKAVGIGGVGPVGGASATGAAGDDRAAVLASAELFNRLHVAMPVLQLEAMAALCFAISSTSLVASLWRQLQADGGASQHRLLGKAATPSLEVHIGTGGPLAGDPILPLMQLFLRCATYTYTIIDDSEVHDKQYPLPIDELPKLAGFCNQLAFALHWNAPAAATADPTDAIRPLVTKLIRLLHERDSRRSFTDPRTWGVADKKLAQELDKEVMAETARAQVIMSTMPHVLPFERRATLFQQWVGAERTRSAAVKTRMRIRRTHIVEDTLKALGNADAATLKSRWHINFVNEQGLDEAGIDEMGLFREFIETTCKTLFSPNLGLFSLTEDQRMYPCVTSAVNPEHLRLFTLAGKLFGRMVFEGIIADLPFAHFFLAKLLHGHAFIDDLQSLDPDLYKNLIFVKHYEGDVDDLALTFAVDEQVRHATATASGQLIDSSRLSAHDVVVVGRASARRSPSTSRPPAGPSG